MTRISYDPSVFTVIVANEDEFVAAYDTLRARLQASLYNEDDTMIGLLTPQCFSSAMDMIHKMRTNGYVRCQMNEGRWKMRVGALFIDMDELHGAILAKDLQWFLSSKYTLLDGTTVDSKAEVDEWLKEFTLKEFIAFLQQNNVLESFKYYLSSPSQDGWYARKASNAKKLYGEVLSKDPLELYFETKNYGSDRASENIANAVSTSPFEWHYTREGNEFWSKLNYDWHKHVSKLLQGTAQFLS